MKKSLKAALAIALAAAFVFFICNLSAGNKLKASEEEGGVSASEQQEEKKVESAPETVKVEQPEEKKEEPAAEEAASEPAAEENVEAEPETESAATEDELTSEEVPTEETSTEETPAEEIPTEEMSAEEMPAEEAPVEETATEEPVEEVQPEVKVSVKIDNKGDIYLGDTVTMSADVTGAPEGYSLKWQYNDGNGWKDLGKNGNRYSFVVDEQNCTFDYRAVVTY